VVVAEVPPVVPLNSKAGTRLLLQGTALPKHPSPYSSLLSLVALRNLLGDMTIATSLSLRKKVNPTMLVMRVLLP